MKHGESLARAVLPGRPSFLAQARPGKRILLIFDEPTTGLHLADIENLLKVFDHLLEQGYSLLVVEHNPDLIVHADYVIDLGPEGGDAGGYVVAQGTPRELMRCRSSWTGKYLRGLGRKDSSSRTAQ